jgi:hypothetical protein
LRRGFALAFGGLRPPPFPALLKRFIFSRCGSWCGLEGGLATPAVFPCLG